MKRKCDGNLDVFRKALIKSLSKIFFNFRFRQALEKITAKLN